MKIELEGGSTISVTDSKGATPAKGVLNRPIYMPWQEFFASNVRLMRKKNINARKRDGKETIPKADLHRDST